MWRVSLAFIPYKQANLCVCEDHDDLLALDGALVVLACEVQLINRAVEVVKEIPPIPRLQVILQRNSGSGSSRVEEQKKTTSRRRCTDKHSQAQARR